MGRVNAGAPVSGLYGVVAGVQPALDAGVPRVIVVVECAAGVVVVVLRQEVAGLGVIAAAEEEPGVGFGGLQGDGVQRPFVNLELVPAGVGGGGLVVRLAPGGVAAAVPDVLPGQVGGRRRDAWVGGRRSGGRSGDVAFRRRVGIVVQAGDGNFEGADSGFGAGPFLVPAGCGSLDDVGSGAKVFPHAGDALAVGVLQVGVPGFYRADLGVAAQEEGCVEVVSFHCDGHVAGRRGYSELVIASRGPLAAPVPLGHLRLAVFPVSPFRGVGVPPPSLAGDAVRVRVGVNHGRQARGNVRLSNRQPVFNPFQGVALIDGCGDSDLSAAIGSIVVGMGGHGEGFGNVPVVGVEYVGGGRDREIGVGVPHPNGDVGNVRPRGLRGQRDGVGCGGAR